MAGNQDLVTYLVLAPEFGGTRFGPFEGLEIRLGSDPDRCHIVLPASLGTISEHAKIIRQGPLNLILSPSDRTATVFLYKQGERRPIQLNTPTAVRPGDSFALVTADGPRFIIEVGELPPEMAAARSKARGPKSGRDRLNADAFKQEGKRQLWTTLLVTGPGQLLQRAYTFIASGAIFQPRNIIMIATLASGWAFGGFMGCRSGGFKRKLAASSQRVENCEEQLSYEQGFEGDVTEQNFHQLAATITRSNLGLALKEDNPLRQKVIEEIKNLRNADDFEWVATGKGRPAKNFERWRTRIEKAGESGDIDSTTTNLLVWAGAHPSGEDFTRVNDSTGNDQCGRGPLSITYRQALRLGFTAMPDGYYVGPATDAKESTERSVEIISQTLAQIPTSAGFTVAQPEELTDTDVFSINPREQCVHQLGLDDRSNERPARLVRALQRTVGPESALLPEPDRPWGATARIAKIYAADIRRVDYTDKRNPGISFKDNHVSSTLSTLDAEGEWVLKQTAEVIAKAILLPCVATLSGEGSDQVKATVGEDNLPSAIACLVLNYKLDNEY